MDILRAVAGVIRRFLNSVRDKIAATRRSSARRRNHNERANPPQHGKEGRRADPTLLLNKELVNFQTAELYLGITSRHRQNLMQNGVLEFRGGGKNRMITTESLRRYLPPRE